MRDRFNLDMKNMERCLTLIHGNYGSGKTFLQGDFLLDESQYGKVLFINVRGEDGYLSIANLGLGEIAETIEDYKDFKELVNDYAGKFHAFALDSLVALDRIITTSVVGIGKSPEGHDDWGKFHNQADLAAGLLRTIAPWGLCVASSDVSVDNVARGEAGNPKGFQGRVTPDLPGRQAAGIAGKMDLVGHMRAETISPKMVKRTVSFQPSKNALTRQRLPSSIPGDIVIPDGRGGWAAIKQAIELALKGGSDG